MRIFVSWREYGLPLLLLLAVCQFCWAAWIAKANSTSLPVGSQIISEILFSPAPDSEVILKEAKLFIYTDGSRVFRRVHYPIKGIARITYVLLADPVTGSYKTVLFKPAPDLAVGVALASREEIERIKGKLGVISPDRLPGPRVIAPSNALDPEDPLLTSEHEQPEATASFCVDCDGHYVHTVMTVDPLFIPLTKTCAYLNWMQMSDCTCWLWDYSSYCWAANPSPLGTHWYVSSCRRGFRDDGQMYGFTSRTGGYYNYDFGDPGLRTDVEDLVKVTRCWNGTTSTAYHRDWGEFSDLIFDISDIYQVDSCP